MTKSLSILFTGRRKGHIACRTADSFLGIEPNAIADAFGDLYDREVKRSLGHLIE